MILKLIRSLLLPISALTYFSALSHPAHAKLIDLDRVLKDDGPYIESIREQVLEVQEIQIGGKNTSGDKTTDPKVLIINPNAKVHFSGASGDEGQAVLGIQMSAFDPANLRKLVLMSRKFNHRFKKIYINNLGYILPIPDNLKATVSKDGAQLQLNLSERQQATFMKKEGCILGNAGLEQSFLQYLLLLNAQPKEGLMIYPFLAALLEDNGVFLFKSFGVPDQNISGLDCLFAKAFTFQNESLVTKDLAQKKVTLKNKEDAQLLEEIRANLTAQNDTYFLNTKETEVVGFPKPGGTRATILNQIALLQFSGFENVSVGFGRFEDWRNKNINGDAYSMLIQATKKKKK